MSKCIPPLSRLRNLMRKRVPNPQPGVVQEIHVGPDGELTLRPPSDLWDFIETWAYCMGFTDQSTRRWEVSEQRAYVGVVHEEGVVVFEF